MSADPRVQKYAELLVDTCLDVQAGWQVLVSGGYLARPLLEAVSVALGRRGAYPLQRVSLSGQGMNIPWLLEAPEEVVAKSPPLEANEWETADALIAIVAPENTRELSQVPQERLTLIQTARRPNMERIFTEELKWVGCQYPTHALAQEAGMSLEEFTEFLYGACLRDWDAEHERIGRYAALFDGADEVHVVAEGTDLRLSMAGRQVKVDAGGANMPGGEFFGSPVEDSAEGTITFSEFPAVYLGNEVKGIRLQFQGGRVVDASAESNEEFLISMLDMDDGARRLGELGIGCNPGITRHLKNTAFDEKIDGTVHLALGNGLPQLGGTNVSRFHWDIVKDLRNGGKIELDGRIVQENGSWSL